MKYILKIQGRSYVIDHPLVMGILNCTPDSFYAGSRKQTEEDVINRVEEIISEGGDIIDVGAMSTRPGGTAIAEDEEMQRLRFALPLVREVITHHPSAITHHPLVSVDTYRPDVARMAVEEYGVDIINDVGAPSSITRHPMYGTVAALHVPYVLMARTATFVDTLQWFKVEIGKLNELGAKDIIIDPGYGFGKTVEQNYQVLRMQRELADYFEVPLLVGVSRKRMIWQTLGTSPDEALNGTTVLNTLALERGAAILRVHDVREAKECVKLLSLVKNL